VKVKDLVQLMDDLQTKVVLHPNDATEDLVGQLEGDGIRVLVRGYALAGEAIVIAPRPYVWSKSGSLV
jgi:hypothetical protein